MSIASPEGIVVRSQIELRTGIYIDGRWQSPSTGEWFGVHDPASGEQIAEVANGGRADAERAMDAAAASAAAWAEVAPRERSDVLRRAYDLLWDRREEVAALITSEMGKPLTEAIAEVRYGAEFLRWFSEEAVRIHDRAGVLPEGGHELHVQRRPVGPCYLVTPWNFPLAMITRKVAPALAAGCTVVLKPAELTPLTAMLLVDIHADAGAPPGVVNQLTSTTPAVISETLLADPRLRKVSFTGSTAVGRALLKGAAEQVLRCSMELGGNAPFIVLEGADVAAAVDGAMAAKFRNTGQACTAANRFLVHESLAGEFGSELARRTGQLTVGPGAEPGTSIGPLISRTAVDRTLQLIDDALARGAEVLTGGHRLGRPGNFLEPTVLMNVPPGSRVLLEEIFAPVAPISTFSTRAEAIEQANATEYGLAAYVYAASPDDGRALARALEVGMVGINVGIISNAAAPFGGVKSSGLGREGGSEGIDEYLALQYSLAPTVTAVGRRRRT